MQQQKDDAAIGDLVCGAGVPKDAYGSFADSLSAKGYIVSVIEDLIKLGPTSPPQNFGSTVDVENTIAYAEAQQAAGLLDAVDMTQIVLMGHSFRFGIVLNAERILSLSALQESQCPLPAVGFDRASPSWCCFGCRIRGKPCQLL
jgi:hypothetical protein